MEYKVKVKYKSHFDVYGDFEEIYLYYKKPRSLFYKKIDITKRFEEFMLINLKHKNPSVKPNYSSLYGLYVNYIKSNDIDDQNEILRDILSDYIDDYNESLYEKYRIKQSEQSRRISL